MLIESDIHWDFITGETKHTPGENLVAVNWILIGSLVGSLNGINKRTIKLLL